MSELTNNVQVSLNQKELRITSVALNLMLTEHLSEDSRLEITEVIRKFNKHIKPSEPNKSKNQSNPIPTQFSG